MLKPKGFVLIQQPRESTQYVSSITGAGTSACNLSIIENDRLLISNLYVSRPAYQVTEILLVCDFG